jgi:predicted DNA-binding transcriptional regulator AlpA
MTKKISDGLGAGPVVPEGIARAYAQVGPTKFDEMIKAEEFPAFIMVGNRRKWLLTELDAWLADRIAKRDAEAAARVAKRKAEVPVTTAEPKIKKLKLRRPVKA